jgi:hypothetical protein
VLDAAEDAVGAVALRLLGRYGDPRGLPSRDQAESYDERWVEGRAARWFRDRVVDRRDEALCRRLSALHEEHRERPITVAVVYGAAHLPAVVAHLDTEFGYSVESAEWLMVAAAPD